MRVDQEVIEMKKFRAKTVENSGMTRYCICSSLSEVVEQSGYCFFIPNTMMKTNLFGEFKTRESVEDDYFLKIKILEPLQLEFMKDDLKSNAESLAEELVKPGINFFYLKNCPYMKKMNLVLDLAS